MKNIGCVTLLGVVVALGLNMHAAPEEIVRLTQEIRENGGGCQVGSSERLGVYIVGVGHATIGDEGDSLAREKARMAALNEIAGFLGHKISSSTTVEQKATTDGSSETFLSSLTTTSLNRFMTGYQIYSSWKTPSGEVAVAAYVTQKSQDASSEFERAQESIGPSGTVMAVGIDPNRRQAEQNALRSAVEQVAGTMVAGKSTVDEAENLHRRLATTAGALVEEYRIVQESQIGGAHHVTVVAKVSKRKIYESYRSYFKALDNPKFFIRSTDTELKDRFMAYLLGKGADVTEKLADAKYVVVLNGRFSERPNPITGSLGTVLNIAVEVQALDGTVMMKLKPQTAAKDSEVMPVEQRHEAAAERVFEKIKVDLDESFHRMVVKMLDEVDS